MKLRNKKTGEVIDAGCRTTLNGDFWITRNGGGKPIYMNFYGSLAELNEEWEDYKPKEPKLEGEVREIVRRWANLHGYNYLFACFARRSSQMIFYVVSPDSAERIEFSGAYVADDFDAGKYSIDELCGEEE